MIEQVTPYLPYYPYLLGALLVFSVLLLLVAWYNLHRRRTAEMWRKRHDSGKRGSRLLWTGLTLFTTTTVISLFSGAAIFALGWERVFFPPHNPYGVRGVAVSYLPSPTRDDTDMDTLLATLNVTPPASPQPAANDVQLDILTLGEDITAHGTPLRTGATFPPDVGTLYIFIHYANMTPGAVWAYVLYHNGQPVWGDASLWALGETGTSYLTFHHPDAYAPGDYDIALFVGDTIMTRHHFTIGSSEDDRSLDR